MEKIRVPVPVPTVRRPRRVLLWAATLATVALLAGMAVGGLPAPAWLR